MLLMELHTSPSFKSAVNVTLRLMLLVELHSLLHIVLVTVKVMIVSCMLFSIMSHT